MKETKEIVVTPKDFQEKFLLSDKRYPAIISAIGTGKTYFLLLKIWKFCQDYPNSLALIVRKEWTDLRDSTVKDFERYFGVTVSSNKDFKFNNGSVIMFRHAAEIEVLKNINLSIFGIEQAEEFETDEQFTFLRDRLRRDNSPLRQGCIIANANGHNWIYKLWINNPPSEEYFAVTATTFDNEDNLPKDFIADLRRMEIESPNHYKQYILNSFDEIGADDRVFDAKAVYHSPEIELIHQGTSRIIMAVDVARFGENETVFSVIKSANIRRWEQVFQETKKGWDTMQTTGRILDLKREFKPSIVAIDDIGIGGGVVDRLSELRNPCQRFVSNAKPKNNRYENARTEGFFILKELIEKEYLKLIKDQILMEQLLSLRFKYKSDGSKYVLSKDDMRKEGLKSPDRADALMMAIYYTDRVFQEDIRQHKEVKAETEYDMFR